jgi:CBS-domain-containing membrane protein
MIGIEDVEGRTAAELVHRRLTTTPASATVGELREYFEGSTSHKLAVVVDGQRFVGAVTPATLPEEAPDTAAAGEYALRGRTVPPEAPAAEARDIALDEPSARLPVVGEDDTLVGVVAITTRRDGFCGT